MTNRNDGGPAFPRTAATVEDEFGFTYQTGAIGMSLLDYFAGQALAGWMAHNHNDNYAHSDVAEACYSLAQAMLNQKSQYRME